MLAELAQEVDVGDFFGGAEPGNAKLLGFDLQFGKIAFLAAFLKAGQCVLEFLLRFTFVKRLAEKFRGGSFDL